MLDYVIFIKVQWSRKDKWIKVEWKSREIYETTVYINNSIKGKSFQLDILVSYYFNQKIWVKTVWAGR